LYHGGKRQGGERLCGQSLPHGFEFLNDDVVELLAQEAVSQNIHSFPGSEAPRGRMPVVMGAGGSGILLHEAIGHAFEADFTVRMSLSSLIIEQEISMTHQCD
jgi:TldD protein